jgi:oxepin-CoA hydrolase/3-oxo-5,6-dehydrosuberyl-CoA semialdehyde dehydrogenase
MAAMLAHATQMGGPAVRAMTFHDRARRLKSLAQYLDPRKKRFMPSTR